MTRTRSLFAMAAAVGVALAALGGAPVAHARGDVTWSVGVGVPGVVVGATNGYPAYVAPPPGVLRTAAPCGVYTAPAGVLHAAASAGGLRARLRLLQPRPSPPSPPRSWPWSRWWAPPGLMGLPGASERFVKSGAGPELRLAQHQHRNVRVREHVLRFAAQQQALQAFASVRGHDDQVALVLLGRSDDGLGHQV